MHKASVTVRLHHIFPSARFWQALCLVTASRTKLLSRLRPSLLLSSSRNAVSAFRL